VLYVGENPHFEMMLDPARCSFSASMGTAEIMPAS
jgi:hypothetical protein